MKSLRFLALGALTLVSIGWLRADTVVPPDPTIKLKTGGGGGSIQIDPTNPECAAGLFGSLNCTSSNAADKIGASGFGDIAIDNNTSQDIIAMNIFIATSNFDQTFTSSAVTLADTLAFQNSFVSTGTLFGIDFFEVPGICSALTGGVLPSTSGCIEVKFFSGITTNPANPCTATNPTNPCTVFPDAEDVAEGPGPLGFVPNSQVLVQSFFGTPAPGFPGFKAGDKATLSLIPEPSLFWLSLTGVVGLLVAKRKLGKA
jgi:hypothetical protein